MIVLLLVGCAAFGAGDQYVGSLTRFWPHAWEIPALSAPWLLLPFLAGCTQRRPWRSALVGALATFVALVGYGLMTISPVEQAAFTLGSFAGFVRSNVLWFVGGAFTGPLFGYLGHEWRVRRARVAAFVTAGAVMLEPLVHSSRYRPARLSAIPFGAVTATELAVGFAMAIWFGWQWFRSRSAAQP